MAIDPVTIFSFLDVLARVIQDVGGVVATARWSDDELGNWVAAGLEDVSAHLPVSIPLVLAESSYLCDTLYVPHEGNYTRMRITAVKRLSDGLFMRALSREDPRFEKITGYYDVRYSKGNELTTVPSEIYFSGCTLRTVQDTYYVFADVSYLYDRAGTAELDIPLDYLHIISQFVRWQIYKQLLMIEMLQPPDRTRTETDVRDRVTVLDHDVVLDKTVTDGTTETITDNTTSTVTGTNPAVKVNTGTTIGANTGTTATAGTEASDSTETTDDDVVNTVIAPADGDMIRWLTGAIEDARTGYYFLIDKAKGTREWHTSGIVQVSNSNARIY